jgi:general transcription factor 3C polypeptide 5 (transcription factor C subunit 1)
MGSLGAVQGLFEATQEACLGTYETLFPPGPALFSSPGKTDHAKGQLMFESGEEEEEEEEEEEDFKPSDGSENEMETEILDYV